MQRITIDPIQRVADTLQLTNEQIHYLQRVLRLKPGDVFIAQDGQGEQWQSQLTEVLGRAQVLSVLTRPPRPVTLELVAALPKTGFDQVVRQATELGVTHIRPLLSERTLLKPSPKKLVRWQRIAQEASEQCERGYVPDIATPVEFTQWIRGKSGGKSIQVGNYFCVARVNSPGLLPCVQALLSDSPQQSIQVVIGPEGGWTPEEITDAIAHGYQATSLGSGILRATTASLTALAIISSVREQLL
ncbi:16S rRNA (uracil(1498)-N(3))-methyltransferase [Leptothoe spongobia]|uniref:Ribosomal RNA small subunit methyltransferase E n=1 Tax=Leptothoe spongobia TAU-MAC 1115 TaxID=1967444 RepID=A0A947DII3_9CYAN|nr:16S rRNA (uracil(1498)-N(3))-methyltransferase [Leptothoe spongobia]MBT9317582.1 16S rRNA (uracil(1498)-N(3))-methyltransferase [Leptothoe spongobia TAU-MAC 1115]